MHYLPQRNPVLFREHLEHLTLFGDRLSRLLRMPPREQHAEILELARKRLRREHRRLIGQYEIAIRLVVSALRRRLKLPI